VRLPGGVDVGVIKLTLARTLIVFRPDSPIAPDDLK
jgi:hypothetical protein